MQIPTMLRSLTVGALLGAALAPAAHGSPGARVAQGSPSTHLAGPVVEIPMDISTRHIGVEVYVNGEGAFPFNLDTYAVTTACVDEAFAERMGFEKIGTVLNGDGSGTVRERDQVLIPELRVGGATFRNVPALVDDYSWVSSPGGGSIDGLLGYHLFRELLLELDYPRGLVVLRKGELDAEDANVVSHAELRERPDFPMHVGGERFVVGIDSGAHSALSLPMSFIERLELVEPPTVAGHARTVYSEAEILAGTLAEDLVFAGHERAHMLATFSELFGKPLLGHDLLVDYAVTFDQRNGRLRFEREPAVPVTEGPGETPGKTPGPARDRRLR